MLNPASLRNSRKVEHGTHEAEAKRSIALPLNCVAIVVRASFIHITLVKGTWMRPLRMPIMDICLQRTAPSFARVAETEVILAGHEIIEIAQALRCSSCEQASISWVSSERGVGRLLVLEQELLDRVPIAIEHILELLFEGISRSGKNQGLLETVLGRGQLEACTPPCYIGLNTGGLVAREGIISGHGANHLAIGARVRAEESHDAGWANLLGHRAQRTA
mmetsp:Transcript_23889/g.59508  ORF Transcript_23889/g.59508 Transcript_23889/m.59508 type:complete len:220 (+) Transcript_23889:296-955(+)